MNVGLFALTNLVGTAVWCTALAFAGNVLGAHFTAVDRIMGPIGWAVLAGLMIAAAAWMWRRRHRQHQT